jgi:hypothetical protein
MPSKTDKSRLPKSWHPPALVQTKVVLLAFFALCGAAEANTYYVATSGSDSNNGTAASAPLQTISHAISVAGPGDTVNIAAGSYSGALHFTKSGSSSSPILFLGAGFTTIIKNQVTVSGSYTTLSAMSFQDSVTSDDPAVELDGTYNILLNCEITNIHFPASSQATALTFGGGSNDTANGVQIHDIADIDAMHVFADHSSFINGQEYNIQELNYQLNHTDQYQTWGGQSGTTASYFTFAGNICTNNSCQGGNTETDGSTKLHDWYIYNNIFNHTDASFFSGLPKTYIANNIYINGGTGGAGVQVSFYTISGGTSTGGNSGKSYDSSGSWVQNNCWIANAGDFGVNGSVAPNPVANNYFASNTSWAAGNPQGTGAINGGNPGFVNAAGGDYHLTSNSILRGKGTNLSYLFTTDKDGNPRPASGAWEIGPYQYAGSAPAAPTGVHVVP